MSGGDQLSSERVIAGKSPVEISRFLLVNRAALEYANSGTCAVWSDGKGPLTTSMSIEAAVSIATHIHNGDYARTLQSKRGLSRE